MKRTLKVIVVGCGSITSAWLEPISHFDDIEVMGLVDLNINSAEKVKNEFKLVGAVTGTSLGEMLKNLRPDAVFDCTVPTAHASVTIEALNAGCHVLGEKPMSDSMESARKMLVAARDNNKIYAIIQNRRYLDKIIEFKNVIESGKIGDLTTLNADFYLGPHFGGFRDKMEHVLLLDMAIHTFDQARFISRKDPLSVYCHEWNPMGSWYKNGASAVAVFEMTDNVVFTYRGSWCVEGLNTSWEGVWHAQGTKGSTDWDGSDKITAQNIKGSGGFFNEWEDLDIRGEIELKSGAHATLIREFANSIESGKTPQTICTDNIKSLTMVHAAVESAESGKKVKINM
ncbi:MAG: Gfo/Idh/MocA family oxidoreductase [Verrucomicrobiota bacterium]|nr:Gfo/Idh/MocA family oxidoreductase [Verrucomicrobiota bacterium]